MGTFLAMSKRHSNANKLSSNEWVQKYKLHCQNTATLERKVDAKLFIAYISLVGLVLVVLRTITTQTQTSPVCFVHFYRMNSEQLSTSTLSKTRLNTRQHYQLELPIELFCNQGLIFYCYNNLEGFLDCKLQDNVSLIFLPNFSADSIISWNPTMPSVPSIFKSYNVMPYGVFTDPIKVKSFNFWAKLSKSEWKRNGTFGCRTIWCDNI